MLRCEICKNKKLIKSNYFFINQKNLFRSIVYLFPIKFLKIIAKLKIKKIDKSIKNIIYNRETFNSNKYYCLECKTGWHYPKIPKIVLNNYYESFYWLNRCEKEQVFDFSLNKVPNRERLKNIIDQFKFINRLSLNYKSIIDFGSGDCAGGYYFKKIIGIEDVSIFDLSKASRKIAKNYGLEIINSLGLKKVDLIYSSHSIEHVSNLESSLTKLKSTLNPNGYIFFEVPNISSIEVFYAMPHTPHTYMFSINSFKKIAQNFGFKIIAYEFIGPQWKRSFKGVKDNSKTDLRICLQKI